jgi:4,5-DOPA dioxygenase extradiol
LRLFAGGRGDPAQPEQAECAAFRQWMVDTTAAADWAALNDYRRQAPHAALMHPTDEHLLPLHVAAGAAGDDAPGRRLFAEVQWGHLGMDAFAFGAGARALEQALSH